MFTKLLVPLDGSAFSEQTLPYAFELASHSNAVVHVVKVHMPTSDHDLGDGLYLDG